MKKSALFILIFTAFVLGGFYLFGSKTNQNKTTVISPTSTTTATATPAPSNNKMTLSDVATHNQKNDCYLVIQSKVYDVSSYISQHPGGPGKIISSCGKEVTGIFAQTHSNFAWDLLKNYQVGQI